MQMSLVSLLAHLESVRLQPVFRLSILILMTNESASYLPLIAYLRQVLVNAHKKAYTISVGKLNPAKLANFAEIECFVLVACPENSLIDAKVEPTSIASILVPSDKPSCYQDFFRPIVTPFELQLALQPSPTWTGDYVLDFEEVLARGIFKTSSDQDEEGDPDRPMFSLMTGRYRHAKRYGGELLHHLLSVPLFPAETEDDRVPAPPPSSSALVLRDQDTTIATLKDAAAGVPFSLCATYQRLNRPLTKANFCNHERSAASKHVRGWIHLASSNKDGAVSRGAMMMTIELKMSKRNAPNYIKMLGDPAEQTAVSTL